MSDIFNNREIALIVYLLIFIIWAMTKKDIRKSIFGVFKVLFNKTILISIILILIYISIIVYGLFHLNLWDFYMLKDTIYWTFGAGFILMMNSTEALSDEDFFRDFLKNNIKLIIILEFIVGLYVFGLITEFVLMPFVILLSLLWGYSENYEEYIQVKNIVQTILAIIGTIYFIYSLFMIYKDFTDFATYNTLRSFLLPIILTILFLPFGYCFALFLHYQSIFKRMEFSMRDDNTLKNYAKKRILLNSNFSFSRLRKLAPGFLFNQCDSKKDIDNEIRSKLNRE